MERCRTSARPARGPNARLSGFDVPHGQLRLHPDDDQRLRHVNLLKDAMCAVQQMTCLKNQFKPELDSFFVVDWKSNNPCNGVIHMQVTKQDGGELKNKMNGNFPAKARKFSMSTVSVLAVLGLCAGVAHAQTNVTMYGTLDGGLRNVVNGTKAGGAALTMASNGVYDQNRWGLQGAEDLGGGYKAVFNLEAGYILATGALDNANNVLFNRQSTVGLAGPFGRVDIGRQFALQHYLIKDFEPFDFRYLGITEAAGVTNGNSSGRDDNDIYYTGAFGPTVIRAEYALGGVAGSENEGSTRAVGFNYRTSPLKFGFGYTHKAKQLVAGTGPFFSDNEYTAGGAYSLGPVTALGGWSTNMQNTATSAGTSIKNQFLWGGLRYEVNPFIEIIAAYYDNKNETAGVSGRKDVAITSITYNLSKRTILYADVDYTKFKGGLVNNAVLNPSGHDSQTGVSFGINQRF